MNAHQQVAKLVETICAHTKELAELMQKPQELDFTQVRESFEQLEGTSGDRTTADAAFAYLAQEANAGRIVHSSRPADYLTNKLGLTRKEANERLKLGNQLFAPPPPEPSDAPEEPSPDEDETAAKARQEREERAKREADAKEKLRRKLAKERRNAVIHQIIRQELENLNKNTTPSHAELYSEAIERAKFLSPDRLRSWLREKVRRANLSSSFHDKEAATRKRSLKISRPDADGGVHIRGYVDAATAALLGQAFSPVNRPGGPDLPEEEDKRSYEQRMADQLSRIVQQYLGSKEQGGKGLGSILIAATLEDLENMTPESRFPTSTGHLLSPVDILRLGIADNDYFACLDPESFQPLLLGRTQRAASLAQKIALMAAEGVCTHPGCDAPWNQCDVHHLQAWYYGGVTDIRNLTLLCRKHHTNNNDHKDFRHNMGHAERDPRSGRVGFQRPGGGPIRFNDSDAASHFPAARLRSSRAQRESANPTWVSHPSSHGPRSDSAPPDPPSPPGAEGSKHPDEVSDHAGTEAA